MATKGGGLGGAVTESASNGQIGYAWEHGCEPMEFRCRENIFNDGMWFANGIVSEAYCPVINTDDYCGKSGDGNGGAGNGSDSLLGGIQGGLFPFGLGNIFNTDATNLIKKALWIIAAIIGLLLLLMYLKKKK